MKHLTRLIALVALCVIGATQARAAFTLTASPRWKPSDPTVQNVVLTWDPISGVGDSDYVVYCDGVKAQNQGPEQIKRNSAGKIECFQPLPGFDRNLDKNVLKPHVFKVVAVKSGVEQTADNMVSKATTVYHVPFVSPKFHANKYKIKLSDKTYSENVRIHWDEPEYGVATEYVIERKKSTDGSWQDIAVLPANKFEYIDKDVPLANATYYYRVKARMAEALYLDPALDKDEYNFVRYTPAKPATSGSQYESIKDAMSADYSTPVLTQPKVASGRNAVSLFWTLTQTSTNIPTYYKVYRNSTLVATIDGLSTVDSNIPDNNPGETYTYKIVAVYVHADGYIQRELESASKTLANPVKLDAAKSRYAIDVVYNYPILLADGKEDVATKKKLDAEGKGYIIGKGKMTNLKYSLGIGGAPGDLFRQAVYRKGKWYISQLTTDTTRVKPNSNDQHKLGVDAEPESSGSNKGAIYLIDANDPLKTFKNATNCNAAQLFTLPDRSNQSVAIDDVTDPTANERIFYRSINGLTSRKQFVNKMQVLGEMKRTTSDGVQPTSYTEKNFSLNSIFNIDYGNSSTDQRGRVHYLAANGRTSHASIGGDVFMAPNREPYAVVYHMMSGTVTGFTAYRCPDSFFENNDPATFLAKTENFENYIYPIPGRSSNDKKDASSTYGKSHFIHFIRNVGVFYVTGNTTHVTKTINGVDYYNGYHQIYGSEQAHTAGGCVFTLGDDMFILNPTSATRNNTGHFRVDICAKKDDGTHYAGFDSFMDLSPAVAFVQDDLTSFEAGNSNANWYGTEYSAADDCVYIYQYVPGVRFAKYRFYKLNNFPRVDPTLDIEIAYDDEDDPQRVVKFDAVMNWQRPTNFDFADKSNYSLDHYKVELLNEAGVNVYGWDQPDNRYNGDPNEVVNYRFKFDGKNLYDIDGVVVSTVKNGKYNINNQDYTLRVTPVFKNKSTNDIIYGETRTDESQNDYEASIVKQRARVFQDGKFYRVDLDFDLNDLEKVDNNQCWKYNQPADYFTIEMTQNAGQTWTEVKDMVIMYRSGTTVNVDGNEYVVHQIRHDADKNGTQTVRNHVVPGCYKFERLATPNAKAQALSIGQTTEELAHSDKAFSNYEGDSQNNIDMADSSVVFPCVAYHVFTSDTQPDFTKYQYRFTVHHAVDNSYIYRSDAVVANIENPTKPVQTGVNDIVMGGDDANAPVEYYNLQGVRLQGEPAPGQVVIRRQGSNVTKIIVK